MRALVTGGAGFIGSTLVDRLLAEGHSVDVVDDLSTGAIANLTDARSAGREFRFHQLDVRAPELVELMARREPEVVFHLAAQTSVAASVRWPVLDGEVNVVGTVQVLEGARAARSRKVVYAASGGTLYGEPGPADLPLAETHPHDPRSPYGVSKKAAVDYLRAYAGLYGLGWCALALANVYGPRQDPHGEAGVVSIFAANLVAGRESTIDGDGAQTRDFVYVDDVVDAFSRAAQRGDGMLVNVGTGAQTSVAELYAAMVEANGGGPAAKHGPRREGDMRDSALDPTRAAIHLGWTPWTPLSDGLRAVLAYAGREGAGRT
ncbi:MAG: GDP-mannose 4,6-dehydratase [Actinomycetota bacterium]|nr:GDP-mannose 4,6-dehydratase [Actinomycetota bacterium]